MRSRREEKQKLTGKGGEDQPAKRMVEYMGEAEPSSIHPLWKHWLGYGRDIPPTTKDIYIWEMEQARLQRRLKEIDQASNKMRAEDDAQRQRGDSGMGQAIAQLASQLAGDVQPAKNSPAPRPTPQRPPEDAIYESHQPSPGSNLAFENGVQIIPKTTKAYSPDPSRLQQILNKQKAEQQAQTSSSQSPSSSPSSFSAWTPSDSKAPGNIDDL